VMEQESHITLRFYLATGKVSLNEIVYKFKELKDPLMLKILAPKRNIVEGERYENEVIGKISEAFPPSLAN